MGAVVCRSPRRRIDWQCVYLLSFQKIILNFSTDFHIEGSIPLLSSSASSQAGERLFGFLVILSTLSLPNRCVQPPLCMDFRALYSSPLLLCHLFLSLAAFASFSLVLVCSSLSVFHISVLFFFFLPIYPAWSSLNLDFWFRVCH